MFTHKTLFVLGLIIGDSSQEHDSNARLLEERKARTRRLGLPEDAYWDDVVRIEYARKFGLHDEATWDEIDEANPKK